jgi:hypothetical protein
MEVTYSSVEKLYKALFRVIILDCEITKEEILSWEDEHEIGFFLEVDLDYPEEIKFKSKNFPFCPQSILFEEET